MSIASVNLAMKGALLSRDRHSPARVRSPAFSVNPEYFAENGAEIRSSGDITHAGGIRTNRVWVVSRPALVGNSGRTPTISLEQRLGTNPACNFAADPLQYQGVYAFLPTRELFGAGT